MEPSSALKLKGSVWCLTEPNHSSYRTSDQGLAPVGSGQPYQDLGLGLESHVVCVWVNVGGKEKSFDRTLATFKFWLWAFHSYKF